MGRPGSDNKQSIPKIAKTPAEQNAIRRAAKKGKTATRATGLAVLANNPHVNATKAARQRVGKIKCQRIAGVRVAAYHPELTNMTGLPVKVAAFYLEELLKLPGTFTHKDAHITASEKTRKHFDGSPDSQVGLGICRARNAVREAIELDQANQSTMAVA